MLLHRCGRAPVDHTKYLLIDELLLYRSQQRDEEIQPHSGGCIRLDVDVDGHRDLGVIRDTRTLLHRCDHEPHSIFLWDMIKRHPVRWTANRSGINLAGAVRSRIFYTIPSQSRWPRGGHPDRGCYHTVLSQN